MKLLPEDIERKIEIYNANPLACVLYLHRRESQVSTMLMFTKCIKPYMRYFIIKEKDDEFKTGFYSYAQFNLYCKLEPYSISDRYYHKKLKR